MLTRRQWGCLAFAMIGLLGLQGSVSAQTVLIGIREPSLNNPLCTAKVTLNIIDSAGKVYGPYYPASGLYNFTMPTLAPADKRVSLRFQRTVGTTNLTIDNVAGAGGAQTFDLVIPTAKE